MTEMTTDEIFNRAMELIGRPTDESFTVTETRDEESSEFVIRYADGTPALVVFVEFSGHGEYEFEVPADPSTDVEPLYGEISIDLLDAINEAAR